MLHSVMLSPGGIIRATQSDGEPGIVVSTPKGVFPSICRPPSVNRPTLSTCRCGGPPGLESRSTQPGSKVRAARTDGRTAKGCPVIPGGRATTATAPRRVVGTSPYIQYADVPPPCDAPHLTPHADPPGITGQPLGFSELRERLPEPSAKVLSQRLRELRARGLLSVESLRGFPVRTRHTLTGRGRALRPLLTEVYATGEALLATGPPAGANLRDRGPIRPGACGRSMAYEVTTAFSHGFDMVDCLVKRQYGHSRAAAVCTFGPRLICA
ncbi:winged helix-turn-helix transcriptional regulator [Streptomyces sp. NPDC055107]